MIVPIQQVAETRSPSLKFIRRPDLPPTIRIQIACAAVATKLSG